MMISSTMGKRLFANAALASPKTSASGVKPLNQPPLKKEDETDVKTEKSYKHLKPLINPYDPPVQAGQIPPQPAHFYAHLLLRRENAIRVPKLPIRSDQEIISRIDFITPYPEIDPIDYSNTAAVPMYLEKSVKYASYIALGVGLIFISLEVNGIFGNIFEDLVNTNIPHNEPIDIVDQSVIQRG